MPCAFGEPHDFQRCSDQSEWSDYVPEEDPDDGCEWVAYACVTCDALAFNQDEIEDDEDRAVCDNCGRVDHSPEELEECMESMVGPRSTDAALDVLAASREERMEALGDLFAAVMPDADDDDRCEAGMEDYR